MPLDQIEARIANLLAEDGRRSIQSIAREIGISRRVVRARIQGLVDGGRMRVSAVIHPRARGLESSVAFCLNVEIGRLEEATAWLADLDDIGWITVVSGRYDILSGGYFRDEEHVSQFIVDRLAKVPGLSRSETFHYLRVLKTGPDHFMMPQGPTGANISAAELDAVDRSIVASLGVSAQRTNTEIARALGISEGAVRHRIRRMEERGLITFAAIVDTRALGHEVDGSFWMRVELSSLLEAAERLATFPQVQFVGIALGRFNVLCRAYFDTKNDLIDFATVELKGVPGVQEIEMFHTLRRVKRAYVRLDRMPAGEPAPARQFALP